MQCQGRVFLILLVFVLLYLPHSLQDVKERHECSCRAADLLPSLVQRALKSNEGYAIMVDDPDASQFLDRSEIASNLQVFHLLDLAEDCDLGCIVSFPSLPLLLGNASEIHAIPSVRSALLASAGCTKCRKVLHKYVSGGDDGVSSLFSTAEGWEILDRPRGFQHLGSSIDEPQDGDQLVEDGVGHMQEILISFRRGQAIPESSELTILVNGILSFRSSLAQEPSSMLGEGGEVDVCDLLLDGGLIPTVDGRCQIVAHIRMAELGEKRVSVLLSSERGRSTAVSIGFTVLKGLLEQQALADRQEVIVDRVRRPVQMGKGSWSWQEIEVPRLNTRARRFEDNYKDFKRLQIDQMLARYGLQRGDAGDFPGRNPQRHEDRKTIAEQIYHAESNAHRFEQALISHPLPNSTIRVLDKVPVLLVLRIAMGYKLLSPEIPNTILQVEFEYDWPGRSPNVTFLSQEQITLRSSDNHRPFEESRVLHRYADGEEAPHFLSLDYSVGDVAVTIPSSVLLTLRVVQGNLSYDFNSTVKLATREPSYEMKENGESPASFSQVFVVTITHQRLDADRLRDVLLAMNLPEPSKWEAFDAYEKIAHEFALLQVSEQLLGSGSGWSVGSFGCAESHYRLLSHIAKHNMTRALVLEHDSKLPQGISPSAAGIILADAMKAAPEDAELLFVGHCHPRWIERENAFWVRGGACCTHGYIVSWAGAIVILNAMNPLWAPIDEIIRDLCFTSQLSCYLLVPEGSSDTSKRLQTGVFVQDWQDVS
mmetsp:Transcript_15141/g.51067  ORF Transcript_15141/g.51067 Transcript_15141/m.51067 type:complete len:765 (-) Transcript_15141:1349-3643(-)